jgi:hypothetical protein
MTNPFHQDEPLGISGWWCTVCGEWFTKLSEFLEHEHYNSPYVRSQEPLEFPKETSGDGRLENCGCTLTYGWKCWGCGEEFTSFDDFLAHEGLPECRVS